MNTLPQEKIASNLLQSISKIDLSIPKGNKILPVSLNKLSEDRIWLYKIDEIAFDDEYPHREAFENVIQTMSEISDYNLVYILEGNEQGICLYLGVVWTKNNAGQKNAGQNDARSHAENLISSFEGNFNGSKVYKIKDPAEINKIISENYPNAGLITGIPSINDADQNIDFQGIDRLINSMHCKQKMKWRLAIVCEPVSRNEVLEQQERVYELYKQLNLYKETQFQVKKEESDKKSKVKTKSTDDRNNTSHNEYDRKEDRTNDNNDGHYYRTDTDTVDGQENRKDFSHSIDYSEKNEDGHYETTDIFQNHIFQLVNKRAIEIMKYIDDEFLPRLKVGATKGMFKTSVYYMSTAPAFAEKLQKNIISLFQGNKISYSPLQARVFTKDELLNLNILNTFQNYSAELDTRNDMLLVLSGRPYNPAEIGLSTYLTTQEISILAGLPQKEVPGIALKSAVSFGLNEEPKISGKEKQYIEIGNLVQKGRELKIPFYLKKDSFSKHIFIAGTTGSGKTTTCHTLIKRAEMPFLVIEPAKTEYRCLIQDKKSDVIVFTLGKELVAPFRINPFEFLKGDNIGSHVDMIKATFTAAYPMEHSMPQMLEEAIYKCYEKKGWNIYTNENDLFEDPFSSDVNSFPIMSDLIAELSEVVNSKGFDARLKNDYIGSLVSRLSHLTFGSKGAMLNCFHSTDFEYIATHNVIMELEGLRSQEDKSLMMGFILTRLSSQIRALHDKHIKEGKDPFRHLTFVEEAHRLLSKVEPGDSGAKKTSVETFSDLLAEVRKYGEGLVIIDQIPNKLSPEVLKNTNTKIIQKLFSQDDKDAVGNTMLMDDEQRKFISALPTGQAIIFTEITPKPVHVKIEKLVETSDKDPEDREVKEYFDKKKKDLGKCYDITELIQFAQSDFSKVILDLKNCIFDKELRKKILEKIDSICKNNKCTEDYVWEQIILAYDSVSGNAMKAPEKAPERIKNLLSLMGLYRNSFEVITFDLISKGDQSLFTELPKNFLRVANNI